MQSDHNLVSLIIPVYNEEANLPLLFAEILGAMGQQHRPWRVVFVDDGSTDGSLAIMRNLAKTDSHALYIALAENRGQSAAFAAGFRHAPGDIFVTMDADLQNDPSDVPAMLAAYDEGFDMLIGWRANRRDTLTKRLASRFANNVRNVLSHETVTDTGCSLKVLKASLAREIPMYTGMHRFLPTLMKMQGARVMEMPVHHRPRQFGISKYGIWDRAFSSLHDLLAIRWMQKRHIAYQVTEIKLDEPPMRVPLRRIESGCKPARAEESL